MHKSVWGVLAFLSPSPGSPSPFLQAKAAPSTQTSSECSPFVLVHAKTPVIGLDPSLSSDENGSLLFFIAVRVFK